MARETKEERLVRNMTSALTEQMIELRNLAAAPNNKESDLEVWCQTVLKSVLGFSASNGYAVHSQETRGKLRFDLVVTKSDQPENVLFLVEVKKLGSDLNKSDFRSGKTQLSEYLSHLGSTRWGILTNGYEWRLYDFKSGGISVVNADIRNDEDVLETSAKGIQEAGWEFVDMCATNYESGTWAELSTEAQALSPDSLARGILSAEIVNKVKKYLNEEHGYKASVEALTDKLGELLVQGLNDLCAGWNDSKKAELDRYIRSQKKAAKRVRKKKVDSSTAVDPAAETAITTANADVGSTETQVTEEKKVA